MIKKLAALAICGALAFSVAACGKKEEAPMPAPTPEATAPAAPAAPMGGMTTAAPAPGK